MISKRTLIGNIVGGAITIIGLYAMVTALGVQTSQLDDTYGTGESASYKFAAAAGYREVLMITGDSFEVEIKAPEGGMTAPRTSHREEAVFDWTVPGDGVTRIELQNTGQSQLHVTGAIEHQTDPILFTYHAMVIVSGVVIVGFSAGFTIRRPRGF